MKSEKIKKLGQSLESRVRIGKNGITKGIIEEINRNIENEGIVKIKILRNCPEQDVEVIASELSDKSDVRLIEVRGRTILLAEK